MSKLAPYLKGLTAALIAGLGVIGASLADSSSLSAQDWVSASIAFLVALGAVFYIPYAPSGGA